MGVGIAGTGFGLISYASAALAEDPRRAIGGDGALVVLAAGVALVATAFPWWMRRQERRGAPALVPNSVWRGGGTGSDARNGRVFVAISLTVLLAWASLQSSELQSSELLLSLFFQRVQGASALGASLRLMPSIAVGLVLNPLTGLCVQRVTAHRLLVGVSLAAAASPLIMVFADPAWPWWAGTAWAVALGPVSVDVLFTMAHLVITDVFPPDMHALAGAVFNTIAQLGTSLGMSLVAVVSSLVTRSLSDDGNGVNESPKALLAGYRAAFATCFVLMFLSAGTSLGLRGVGKLGQAAT